MKIKVGDKVEIISRGHQYTTYEDFYKKYKTKTTNPFTFGEVVREGKIGIVQTIKPHKDTSKMVAIVNVEDRAYIMNVEGLEFISREKTIDQEREDIENQIKKLQYKLNSLKHKHEEELLAEYKIKEGEVIETIFKGANGFDLISGALLNASMVLIRRDNKIICEITENGIVTKGVARCLPEDKFNYYIGSQIAIFRAKKYYYEKLENNFIEGIS